MSQPQFSVVIPTRNRPATLPFALRTCLQQDHPDYEVVVCDNSDSPATREVVDQFACDRLRYVKAPEPLAACDNWNLALSHTRGEYVIYIGDDDALLPHSLTQLAALLARTPARALTWGSALYSWPSFVEPEEANVLIVPVLREIETVDAKPCIGEILARRAALSSLPNIYHGAVHREIIDRVRRPDGGVFQGSNFDTVASISFAHAAGDFVSTTVPFSLSGFSGASNHAGFRLRLTDHPASIDSKALNERGGYRLHPWVPDVPCGSAVLADSFLKAKTNLFPDDDLVLDRKSMATWQLSELPYTDPEQRRRAVEKIRETLKDSDELVAWFDSQEDTIFPPAPPSMFPRGGLGFNGNSLVMDAAAFGVADVAAAAKLCADVLRFPAGEVPHDLPDHARMAERLIRQVRELDVRMQRMAQEFDERMAQAVERGSLRNVPRRLLGKFASLIRPSPRAA